MFYSADSIPLLWDKNPTKNAHQQSKNKKHKAEKTEDEHKVQVKPAALQKTYDYRYLQHMN